MNSITVSVIALACVFGASVLGMFLRRLLPDHHLSQESRAVLQLGMSLMVTMTALLLSLQLGAAKSTYDIKRNELTAFSVQILLLDRELAHCGPDAHDIRSKLRARIERMLETTWPQVDAAGRLGSLPVSEEREALYDEIQELSPKDEAQRAAKIQALSTMINLGQERWLLLEQQSTSASLSLVVVAVVWMTIVFVILGLFAPRNGTVFAILFVCAAAVAGAVFLILELYSPFRGVIRLSSEPIRNVLAHLGQ